MLDIQKKDILEIYKFDKLSKAFPLLTEDDLIYLFLKLQPIMGHSKDIENAIWTICTAAELSSRISRVFDPKELLTYYLNDKLIRHPECSSCHRTRKVGENYCPVCGKLYPFISPQIVIEKVEYQLLKDKCDSLEKENKRLRSSQKRSSSKYL